MDCQELIAQLGYKDNPAFLQKERLTEHPGYSFFFSQAQKMEKGATFHGVYSLVNNMEDGIASSTITPVVYVFEAENENIASHIHKKVWCQNTVPYVIVTTPKNIRLYSGFEYDKSKSDAEQALAVAKDANEILDKLSTFTAGEIDSGNIWQKQTISTEGRVDRHLLTNLKTLSEILTGKDYKLSPNDAHSLIGKYIYLKYLRDRGILSDVRLEDAQVTEEQVYGRTAQKEKLYDLEKYLDGFLNGSVFPLPSQSRIKTKHVQKIAGAFKGDDPTGQQVLFDLYDFSYVPIETLSVVYQQFLHQEGKGRAKGAYYTPVHLVNFILDKLDAKKPLQEGMKVFDPSCGSGAFLVQCYRRLVERIRRKGVKLNPTDLRRLLVDHIFGLDTDEEACRVAELSLSLTLLDYIDPPDLSTTRFKLPNLHNSNIFHCEGGFFDEDSLWVKSVHPEGYDWIVGNPPWKNIDKKKAKACCDIKVIEWIDKNKKEFPVDNCQVAEAFVWKTKRVLSEKGQSGLLMPAMTLFKTQGKKFRSKFFSTVETWYVVNFANLRHHLFEGATNPATAFFFTGRKDWDKSEHYITTYTPFAVEQTSQLEQIKNSKKVWSVFVNSHAVKEIPLADIQKGSSMPWKIAMWGVQRDNRFLKSLLNKYPDLSSFVKLCKLDMHQGPEFRTLPIDADAKILKKFYAEHKYCPEYVNENYINVNKISENDFSLPNSSYKTFKENEVYLRKRGGEAGLKLFAGPHILVSASRKFSVYSSKSFMVPARQIGIAGKNTNLLKAMAIYFKSFFGYYEQWLTSTALGVERDNTRFNDLKSLPIPFLKVTDKELSIWAELHDEIVMAQKHERENDPEMSLFDDKSRKKSLSLDELLKKMNDKVYKCLGITEKQRWLIEDMLNVRMKLNEGRIAKEAVKPATEEEISEFARIFQEELDLFLDHTGDRKVHKIGVHYTDQSAVLVVDHLERSKVTTPEVVEVCDKNTQREFDNLQSKLTVQKSQWIYFTRCLRIYEGRRTYIFKPRQRLYWLKSQALAEADEFIEGKVGAE